MKAEVRQFLAGERQRFVSYARSLVRYSSDLDAEDIVQDVLLRMLEKADLPASDLLLAYVYRALQNRVIDQVRARKRTVSDEVLNELADENSDTVSLLQTEQGRIALFRALGSLAQIERNVIIAHEFEGTSFKELSQRFDVPQNTLLSHKARGLKKLKQILKQTDV